jgi:hypothetical protein
MGKWFQQYQALVWAVSLALASLVFVYQTFATTQYVDVKHESVMTVLQDIREDVREIRIYQMGRK